MLVTEKRCARCAEVKSTEEFHRNSKVSDGRVAYCKPCIREYQRERYASKRGVILAKQNAWRAENEEYVRAQRRKDQAAYRLAHPDRISALRHKRRAHKASARHEPYSRAAIFARWSNTCCYCDAPAAHLDHVTALSRGGDDVESNLVPACAPCNLSKNAKSLADWALSWF